MKKTESVKVVLIILEQIKKVKSVFLIFVVNKRNLCLMERVRSVKLIRGLRVMVRFAVQILVIQGQDFLKMELASSRCCGRTQNKIRINM